MIYDGYSMGMISPNVIKKIEEQVDIVEFISHYVTFVRRGDRYLTCCPFHTERTPSFSVNPARQIYYCFGCKKSGNLFQFVMDMEKLSFVDSIRYLANRLGIPIEEESSSNSDDYQQKRALLLLYQRITKTFEHCLWNTKEGERGLQYLIGRGLSENTVKYYHLGYTPADRFFLYSFLSGHGFSKEILEKSGLFLLKYPTISLFCNRIVFPIMQATGEIIGFSGRTLVIDDNDKKTPKYLNTSDTIIYNKGKHLYGFFQAKGSFKEEGFMLCEGAMDVCSMFEMGYTRAVASLGTGFTEEQAKLLKRYTDKGCIIFDNDSAGEKAKKTAILLCTKQDLRVSVFEHCEEKDPGEILEKKNFKGLQKSLDNVKIPVDFLVDVARRGFPDTNFGAFDICQAIFPFVAVVSSPVLQDGVLRHLALRVDLKEGVVFDEFKRFSKKNSAFSGVFGLNEVPNSSKQNTLKTENVQFRGTIYELLGIFLKNPGMYHDFLKRLKMSWFYTNESRMVVSYLKEDCSIDFSQWIAEQAPFDDTVKQYLLKEFYGNKGVLKKDVELVNRIIGLLELKRLEEKRLELVELIRDVEGRNGDVHSVVDLVGDYVLIVRELQELRAGL